MHQIQFAGGAYSATPDLLAGFKGPISKGREGREGKGGKGGGEERDGMGGKEKEGKVGGRGRGREGRGEDVEGPGKWSAPGPVLALGGPEYCYDVWYGKTRMVWLPDGKKN